MEQEFRSHPLALAKIFGGCFALGIMGFLFLLSNDIVPKDMFQHMLSGNLWRGYALRYFFVPLVITLLTVILAFWSCSIRVRVTSTDVVFTRWGMEYLRLPLNQWSFSLAPMSETGGFLQQCVLNATKCRKGVNFSALRRGIIRVARRDTKTCRLYGLSTNDGDLLLSAIHDAQQRKGWVFAASASTPVVDKADKPEIPRWQENVFSSRSAAEHRKGINFATPSMTGVGLDGMDNGRQHGSSPDDGDLEQDRSKASTASEWDFAVDRAGVMKWRKKKLLPKIAMCTALMAATAMVVFIECFDSLKNTDWLDTPVALTAFLLIPLLCIAMISLCPMIWLIAIYVKLQSVPERISCSGKHLMIDDKSFYVGKLAKVRLTPATYPVNVDLVSMRALRKLVVEEKDGQTHSWCMGKASGEGTGFTISNYRKFHESLRGFCRNMPGLYADML